jgi:hypothetical protein
MSSRSSSARCLSLRDFGQELRGQLAECGAGAGLPAEVLIDERTKELVVPGSLITGEGSTKLAALASKGATLPKIPRLSGKPWSMTNAGAEPGYADVEFAPDRGHAPFLVGGPPAG